MPTWACSGKQRAGAKRTRLRRRGVYGRVGAWMASIISAGYVKNGNVETVDKPGAVRYEYRYRPPERRPAGNRTAEREQGCGHFDDHLDGSDGRHKAGGRG